MDGTSELTASISQRFPSLRPRFEAERRFWEPEAIPGTIALEDLFRPYVEELLAGAEANKAELENAFEFIEEMITSADPAVEGVARVCVLEGLEQDSEILEAAKAFMGPESRRRIPTHTWLMKEHGRFRILRRLIHPMRRRR